MTDLVRTLVIAFALLMAVVPWFVIRARRRQYLLLDLTTWLVPVALVWLAPLFGIALLPSAALALLMGVKLGAFFAFL
ncbi:MAG TPA: hypothetical protein VM534_08980, partial [Thermoanaerobaculia bacterium]|nr:hypothetical protein [Thermoanaerobaculia bacterium]